MIVRWMMAAGAALALAAPATGQTAMNAAAPSTTVAPASADTLDTDAARFVDARAREALDILQDEALSEADKKTQFRAMVDEIADVNRISRFVLGRYARGASEEELAAFQTVFREYAIGVYEDNLSAYAGETLRVLGSVERRPGDTIVQTQVQGGAQDNPIPVNWRVLERDGVRKVVDVEVLGVWLAVNQREEITGIIGQAGGEISAATEALETRLDADGA